VITVPFLSIAYIFCSGELASKRRQRVAAEARCQELRCELRRAVGAVGVGLEQAVLDALHADNVEAAYELAVQQLEKVGAPIMRWLCLICSNLVGKQQLAKVGAAFKVWVLLALPFEHHVCRTAVDCALSRLCLMRCMLTMWRRRKNWLCSSQTRWALRCQSSYACLFASVSFLKHSSYRRWVLRWRLQVAVLVM
jgi:hypothetical protein